MLKTKILSGLKTILPVAVITLSGCATVFTGTTQSIQVQAVDSGTHNLISGARCTVIDGQGAEFVVGTNPGSVILTKGKGALNVRCVRPGYVQKQVGVGQSFNAWTIVNVLFWPGVLVDAVTGAIQQYPSHITVLMEPAHRKH
ncbi:MAG: hypothetical protein K2X50_00430 [Gammaproteobacteria bacterium]|nr:hypothetical protein [Gammaproteobacteria bacterium]